MKSLLYHGECGIALSYHYCHIKLIYTLPTVARFNLTKHQGDILGFYRQILNTGNCFQCRHLLFTDLEWKS